MGSSIEEARTSNLFRMDLKIWNTKLGSPNPHWQLTLQTGNFP